MYILDGHISYCDTQLYMIILQYTIMIIINIMVTQIQINSIKLCITYANAADHVLNMHSYKSISRRDHQSKWRSAYVIDPPTLLIMCSIPIHVCIFYLENSS
jgi:hypothetical protein